MFEKEAEEYLKTDGTKAEQILNMLNEISPLKIKIKQLPFVLAILQQVYQDGAEFGYNKANEWHYPSKGEYPKECENVWCYCKGIGIKFCCVGHTIVGGDNKVRWWANNKTEELRVIAWKEIVLPELKESRVND